jgi:hypothetical protein
MRKFYLLALITLPVTAWIAFMAASKWQDVRTARDQNDGIRAEIAGIERETHQMEQVQDYLPAKYTQDALSDFFTRTLEAGEVLGAGVRIEGRSETQTMNFQPLKYNLQVAQAAVQAAAERQAAPALFSMLEEEIHAMPVVIRSAEAKVFEHAVTLRLEVEVFGR